MSTTKLQMPVLDGDDRVVVPGIVGDKRFKASPDALPRPFIMALADVPSFHKFSLDGKLYEKQREGRIRKMQPGRISTVEIPDDTLVIIVL